MRWMHRGLCLAAGLALFACDDGEPTTELEGADATLTVDAGPDATPIEPDAAPEPVICETQQRWSDTGDSLDVWPDPRMLAEDPSSATGYRLDPDPARFPWIDGTPNLARATMDDLGQLSGFGRTGGVLFRFTAPIQGVPSGAEASLAEGTAATILDLSTDPPTPVAFQLETGEDGAAIVLVPNVPLKAGTLYAALLGPGITDADGGCVGLAPELHDALHGTLPAGMPPELADALKQGITDAGWSADTLAAATVFVTADDLAPIVDAAASLAERSYDWLEPLSCAPNGTMRRCDGAFEAYDFRDDTSILTAEPQPERWRLQVSVWMPAGEGPFPTIIYGHGLGGDRNQARHVAAVLVPQGYAVAATDALHHGAHPTVEAGVEGAIAFLGLDARAFTVDGMMLRGNFNQTALDRLQLLQALRQAPDLDADGTPEIDPTQLGYWGISLGGLLGPATMALSPDLGAGVFSVAGGGLMAFATETENIAQLRGVLNNLAGGEAALQRYLVVMQSIVDAGDPALWATHILRDRLRGEPANVLLPVCLEDGTVPPSTGRTLARALGVPHIAPELHPVDGVAVVAAPVSDNVNGVTGGYFQFDRVGDPPRRSSHNNTADSAQGGLQAATFFNGWLEGEAVIIDPYEALGTPPLR